MVQDKRRLLLQQCEDVIFEDQDCISPTPREILWRKGYYDTISTAKRLIYKTKPDPASDGFTLLNAYIVDGIDRLKKVILGIEDAYNLDLQYVIDFGLFTTDPTVFQNGHEEVPINKKITSLDIINYALESMHSLIISVGDLHRYYLDFGLNNQFNANVTHDLTARYYFEAFKLNPKVGMPQNQLGTLFLHRNHALDSVYHYLYSLICKQPFQLSESNVVKLFQKNAYYLEGLQMDDDYEVNLRDFIARYLVIVDMFFFDKEVSNFNELCSFLLCDLNFLIRKDGGKVFDQDSLFKVVAILFFCMDRLKKLKSSKVYHLNAFLVAICDQFVEVCHLNFEQFFKDHDAVNEDYRRLYSGLYQEYNRMAVSSRGVGDLESEEKENVDRNGTNNNSVCSLDLSSSNSTSELDAHVKNSSNDQKLSLGSRHRHVVGGDQRKIKKVLRRRRRVVPYSSDSDLTSNFDSESDDLSSSSEEDDDHDDDDNSDESNAEGELHKDLEDAFDLDSGSDVVIEDEQVVYFTDNHRHGHDPVGRAVENNDKEKSEYRPMSELQLTDQMENLQLSNNRLRHKISMPTYDPNLVLQFIAKEPTIRSLKILFDWLMNNKDIVWGCYESNPKFVHKIMALLNGMNVNMFTQKVFFDRQLLTAPDLRHDIRSLFDVRGKIPIAEDFWFKHFDLFESTQLSLDWEIHAQMKVTQAEEGLLRVVKLKNFGFFICDRKKFGYSYRNCMFEMLAMASSSPSVVSNRNRNNQRRGRNRKNRGDRRGSPMARGQQQPKGASNGGRDKFRKTEPERRRQISKGTERYIQTRKEGADTNVSPIGQTKRGGGAFKQRDDANQSCKNALMGKLWLRNEVKNLESKVIYWEFIYDMNMLIMSC